MGYYCLAGTLHPTPCPRGTIGTRVKLMVDTECDPCPAGYYCDELGLTQAKVESRNKICDAGYYCIASA